MGKSRKYVIGKYLLLAGVLLASVSTLLFAQSREELIRKYSQKLKTEGVIKSDLTDSQVEGISRNPGSASSIVEYSGSPVDAKLVAEAEREFLAAGQLGQKLTSAERTILSENPDKAGKITEITEYAQRRAKEEARKNPNVSEDSYRHVLWGYMLSKEFGDNFSEQVTQAHEIGSDNTMGERQRDLRNNAVGRRMARQGASEGDILSVFTSSASAEASPGDGEVSSSGEMVLPQDEGRAAPGGDGTASIYTVSAGQPVPAPRPEEKISIKELAIEKGVISPDHDAARIINGANEDNNVIMWIVMTNEQRERLLENAIDVYYWEHAIKVSRPARYYVQRLNTYVREGLRQGTITSSEGIGNLEKIFRDQLIESSDFLRVEK